MSSRTLLYGDTVDSVTPDAPGTAAWARPGADTQAGETTSIAPGQPAPVGAAPRAAPPGVLLPPPGPPQGSAHGGRNRLIWVILSAAALLSIAAIGLTAVKWTSSPPPATTTTVTGGPPSYSQEQIAAAKKQACDANATTAPALSQAQRALAAIPDRNSPEAQSALANFQMVVMVETEYLKSQTSPAAPEAVRSAVSNYVAALLSEVDAETRSLSYDEINSRGDVSVTASHKLIEICRG